MPSHLTISFKLVSTEHSELRVLVLTFREDVNVKRRRNLQMIYWGKDDERIRDSQKKYSGEDEAITLHTTAVASLALAQALQVESV